MSLSIAYQIIDNYLDKLNPIFKQISMCKKEGIIDKYLNYPICYSGFKRLN